ncbi:MAG: hypothetical protein RL071_272 [Pseudomonadota bacterium]
MTALEPAQRASTARAQLQVWTGASRFIGLTPRPEAGPGGATALSGVTVVGDLLDAPLIGAAMAAGDRLGARLAAAARAPTGDDSALDVLIVGAGPAGACVALALQRASLRYRIIDQHDAFATVAALPTGKMIYAEGLRGPAPLPFTDGTKDAQVARWRAALDAAGVKVEAGLQLVDLVPSGGALTATLTGPGGASTVRSREVVLAIGRRGQPVPLPLRSLAGPPPLSSLGDPAEARGQRCVVAGGGDSAAEAAVALVGAGAEVTLVVRGPDLSRARPRNQERVRALVEQGQLRLLTGAEITARTAGAVALTQGGAERSLPCDRLYALLGATPPYAALRRWGLPIEGDWRGARALGVLLFAVLVYIFYVLKGKWGLFPFGPGDPLEGAAAALTVQLGGRELGPSFWGTLTYSLLVLVFGLRAMSAHPGPAQRRRYLSLIGFQVVLLFAVPELIAPLLLDRPWKVYALTVPWPLSIWSLVDAPGWADGDVVAAVGWLALGGLSTFVLIPLYVRKNGLAFCSRLCGCGGLAETMGDLWRSRAPRGPASRQAEWAGRLVLFAAIPTTALILLDAWGVGGAALGSTKAFAQRWYGLMVDFGLASLAGVALYPALGNRAWCRFFCPLRAYMEVLARAFAKPQIVADSRCIGCEQCTRHCQMGIEVQRFAQTGTPLHNGNSACIQCGVCVEVCPMDVLELRADRPVQLRWEGFGPPRPPWEAR